MPLDLAALRQRWARITDQDIGEAQQAIDMLLDALREAQREGERNMLRLKACEEIMEGKPGRYAAYENFYPTVQSAVKLRNQWEAAQRVVESMEAIQSFYASEYREGDKAYQAVILARDALAAYRAVVGPTAAP